eukprot:4965815-Pleurochrysis_carterae.AAC.1
MSSCVAARICSSDVGDSRTRRACSTDGFIDAILRALSAQTVLNVGIHQIRHQYIKPMDRYTKALKIRRIAEILVLTEFRI